jgi:AhpD family alkylhydroperoxidase
MKNFSKRTFDLLLLVRSLVSAIVHLPVFIAALLFPSTSRALREKVMLAVTAVNDCRYCSYVHTGLALANGVDLDELRQLLDRATFGEVDERDAVAALFAQHFAETVRHPSPSARAALARQFNAYQRLEIMAYIHAIYLANLFGNSFDAWVERLSGRPVADGHPFAEAIPAILMAPFAGYFALRGRISARRAAAPIKRP